jgi:SAM-dependent methyltransferase
VVTGLPDAATALDRLAADWERMSERYLPGRSALIGAAVRIVTGSVSGERPLVVDLGSGPGTVLDRVVVALPDARAVAIEPDPVLAAVHRLRSSRSGAPPQPCPVDLAAATWSDAVAALGPVDVVLAVQVLHYLPEARCRELLAEVRALLAPRGVLVHLDTVPVGDRREPGGDRREPTGEGADDDRPAASGDDAWTAWWRRAAVVPALAPAFARRGPVPPPSAEFHPDQARLEALLAGSGLVRTVARHRHGGSLLTVVGAG